MNKNSKEAKLFYITFFIFGLFPLLPFRLKPAGVVALTLLSLWAFAQNRKFRLSKMYLNNAAIFLAYLFSFFFSADKLYAAKYLETSLSLILLPLSFSLISANFQFPKELVRKTEMLFYKVFFISSVIYAIFIFIYIYYLGYFSGKVTYDYTLSYISNMFWGFGEDLIYISISLIFSLFFSIRLMKIYPKQKLLILLGNTIILLALIYISRKGVLIAGIISLFFIILKEIKAIKYQLLIIILTITSIWTLYRLFPNSQKRIKEFLTVKTYTQPVDIKNSTSIRLQVYKCAFRNIKKAGLFGFGIGDVKDEMYKCYKKHAPAIAEQKLGTHNVYLNVLLGQGYLGLFLFIVILFNLFKFSIKSKDVIFIAIILFYSIEFLTENILNRQNGVILFALLINYKTYLSLTSQKSTDEN